MSKKITSEVVLTMMLLIIFFNCAKKNSNDSVKVFLFVENLKSALVENRMKIHPAEKQKTAKDISFSKLEISSSERGLLNIYPDEFGEITIPHSAKEKTETIHLTYFDVNLDQTTVSSIVLSVENLSGYSFRMKWIFSHEKDGSLLIPIEKNKIKYHILLQNYNNWLYPHASPSTINVKNLEFIFSVRKDFRIKSLKFHTREDFISEDAVAGQFFDGVSGSQKRNVLFLANGKSLTYDLHLPRDPYLTYGVKSLENSSTFIIEIKKKDGKHWEEIEKIKAGTEAYADRCISLKKYSKKSVKIKFTVLNRSKGFGLWSSPILFSRSYLSRKKSLVIYLMDAMRADHIGCYGFVSKVTQSSLTPTIDRLAKKGVVFENAYSSATCTSSSVPLLFTGMSYTSFPVPYVIHFIPDSLTTIANLFRDNGFITILVTETPNAFIRNNKNGFDYIYYHPNTVRQGEDRLGQKRASNLPYPNIFVDFQEMLKVDQIRPVFVYIHMNDPHWPFRPSLPIVNRFLSEGDENRTPVGEMRDTTAPDDIDYFRRLYQGSIMQADQNLSMYIEAVEDTPRLHDSYLILTSDHGELLYENEMWTHCLKSDHDGLLLVPYIWIDRARSLGIRRTLPVKTIDTFPSIISLYGFKKNFDIPLDGESLFEGNLGRGRSPTRRFIFNDFTSLHSIVMQNNRKYSMVEINQTELDPDIPILEIRREISRKINERKKKSLNIAALAKNEEYANKGSIKSYDDLIDPDVLEQLKALGYIK